MTASSSLLVIFPIAFGIVYLCVCVSVVIVAIRTGTTQTKTPLVCASGAYVPAYYIYSIGSSISALLLLGSAISHGLYLIDLTPEKSIFIWTVTTIACVASLFLALMGIIPMKDPYKEQHNIVGILFISLGCCYSGMLVGVAFAAANHTTYPTLTIALRLVAAIIIGTSCTIAFVHLQIAENLVKERKKSTTTTTTTNTATDLEEATGAIDNNKKNQRGYNTFEPMSSDGDDESQPTKEELSAWKITAIGQYVALVGVDVAVTSLALEVM